VGDYTYFLGCGLARLGHEVHVLTARGVLDDTLYPLPPNFTVHRIVEAWGLRALPQVVQSVRALRCDVVVIQYAPHAFDGRGITLGINLLPLLIRALTPARVVTTFHEAYVPLNASPRRVAGSLWQRAMAVVTAYASHALVTPTPRGRRGLRRAGILKPIALIPVGSNIPVAALTAEERATIRRRVLGASDGVLVGGFGNVHDRDLVAVFVAVARLQADHRAAGFVWAGGSGADRERRHVEQLLRAKGLPLPRVEFTGPLPHPEISRTLGACDIAIMPFVDGVSARRTSAITALQHGLPLLTTRGPQVDPRFAHGVNAYLVPAGDCGALAEALLALARRADLRERIAKGARTLYERHFVWELITDAVARLAETSPRRAITPAPVPDLT
jgi:glycosyltransferase involved in cell wall biosynthesis